jgi:hypothetical protein
MSRHSADMYLRAKLVVVVVALLGWITADASAGLKMRVSPTVSVAPTDVFIYVFVERRPDNRLLRVLMDSDEFSRSSDVQLEGEKSSRLTIVRYRQLPAGSYDVEVALIGSNGRTVEVARTSINVIN